MLQEIAGGIVKRDRCTKGSTADAYAARGSAVQAGILILTITLSFESVVGVACSVEKR